MQWEKVTIVGVGLLGGSLGLALQRHQLARRIWGYVRRQASVVACQKLGVVNLATLDLGTAVKDAGLIVLCTPIAQMRPLAEAIVSWVKPGTIVTDVGSVKASVVAELEPLFAKADAHFVGSHPMAGAEKTGPSAARPDLFSEAVCVVTPTPGSHAQAVDRVERFWKTIGARTFRLSPEIHDELVARCSHLPHAVAAALASYVLSPAHPKEQAELCANGFRDTTRIASGSPEMWRDIALGNRDNLARVIGAFIDGLQEFQHALQTGDKEAVQEFFQRAKQRRDAWCAQNASPE